MTPQEFKAWFEGFTEAFSGVPTKAQWARVKERVAEIDGKPVTERVFIDRYVDRYWPRYGYVGPVWPYLNATAAGNAAMTMVGSNNLNAAGAQYQQALVSSFNSTDAMTALGRADAKALAA